MYYNDRTDLIGEGDDLYMINAVVSEEFFSFSLPRLRLDARSLFE